MADKKKLAILVGGGPAPGINSVIGAATIRSILVLEAALDTVRPAAIAKGIGLDAALDPRAGPIMGDPGRLQQMDWNLLMNAVKFTPKGGRVQLHLQRRNSHLEVTVSDTGQGIASAPF